MNLFYYEMLFRCRPKNPTFGKIEFIFVSIKLIRKMPISTIFPCSACLARYHYTFGLYGGSRKEVAPSSLEVLFFVFVWRTSSPSHLAFPL